MTQIIEANKSKYALISILGEGAYSKVWSAYSFRHEKIVAIKIICDDETRAGTNEIETYRNLKNIKGIINMIDSFIYKGSVHIVMEWMCCSLYGLLKKGYIEFKSCLVVINSIIQTVHELHKRGIMHADIKPENILIRFNDPDKRFDQELVKLEKSLRKIKRGKKQRQKIISRINSYKRANGIDVDKKNKDSDYDSSYYSYDSESDSKSNSESTEGMSDEMEPINIYECSEFACTYNSHDIYDMYDIYDDQKCFTITKDDRIVLSDMSASFNVNTDEFPRSIHTCYYRAPEVILGCDYDLNADVWALGCTIYEIITGNMMFDVDAYEGIDDKKASLYMMNNLLKNDVNMYYDDCIYPDVFFKNDKTLKYTGEHDTHDIIQKIIGNFMRCNTVRNYSKNKKNNKKLFNCIDAILSMVSIDYTERCIRDSAF